MADISPQDLIDKFQYAIDNRWGYIYATAGVMWTAEKQAAATREQTIKCGKQWIGHMVADCSGLFSWAFKQLGGYMYHGSNTMWDRYCKSKGELRNGKREDGQGLKPGTAVFTYNKEKKNRGHVGLYIGDGWVIEAEGTQHGVVKSRVTLAKWVEWGELKGVDYSGIEPGPTPPEPTPTPGHAIVTGKNVALRQGPSTSTPVRIRIVTGTIVNIARVEGWTYVKYKSQYGFMMNEFINIHEKTITVTGKNVALRAGTDTGTKVLARIPTGTEVDRAELPDGWEYIEYNGKKGFMMKEYIREG